MLKKYVRIIVLLVCVLLLPLAASAEMKTGTWGDNLTWSLTDEGVLTISGNGEMAPLTYWEPHPGSWQEYGADVRSVIIQEGVTSISDGAFFDFESLRKVTIPSTVTRIGEWAFCMTGIDEIVIPEGVTEIAVAAFVRCYSLTSISLPKSLVTVGDASFRGCTSLEEFTLNPDNPSFKVVDGALLNKAGTELLAVPSGKTGDYSIPEGVKKVWPIAFQECGGLNWIYIPDSVTEIGNVNNPVNNQPFGGCTGLYSFNVSSGNPNYKSENGILYSKDMSYLLAAPAQSDGSLAIPDSVKTIGNGAFENSGLTKISIPESVTTIYPYAFYYCKKLVSIRIPSGVSVLNGSTFLDCTSLKKITLTLGLKEIGNSAFAACDNLADVYFEGTQEDRAKIVIRDANDNLTNATWHYKADTDPSLDEVFSVKITPEKTSLKAGEAWTINYEIKGITEAELADENNYVDISIHKWAGMQLADDNAKITDGKTMVNRYADQFRLTKRKGSVTYTPEKSDAEILEAEIRVSVGDIYASRSVYATVTGAQVVPQLTCTITMQQDSVRLGQSYSAKYEITGMSSGEYDSIYARDIWSNDYYYKYDGENNWSESSHWKNGRDLTATSGTLTATATEGKTVGFSLFIYSDGWTLFQDDSMTASITTTGANKTDKKGWYSLGPGELCFANENGYPIIGRAWLYEDGDEEGGLYYFDENGIAVRNGWITMPDGTIGYASDYKLYQNTLMWFIGEEETKYAFDDEGALIIDDYFYGLGVNYHTDKNGIVQTGFFVSQGHAFYANDDGKLEYEGFKTIDGNTYMFTWGESWTGLYTDDGKTYYFDDTGVMQTGWQTIGDDRYYFDPATGIAATGDVMIEGVLYTFSAKGVLTTGKAEKVLPGDVNADGNVDGSDVVRLMKYLAEEEDPATGKVYEINKKNADVCADGTVDAKDLLRLARYLGGEQVVLEEGKAE